MNGRSRNRLGLRGDGDGLSLRQRGGLALTGLAFVKFALVNLALGRDVGFVRVRRRHFGSDHVQNGFILCIEGVVRLWDYFGGLNCCFNSFNRRFNFAHRGPSLAGEARGWRRLGHSLRCFIVGGCLLSGDNVFSGLRQRLDLILSRLWE